MSDQAPILNYQNPLTRRQSRRPATELLKAAKFCALIPLVLGCADFIAWIFTRSDNLAVSGLGIIALGVLLSLAGCCCLLGYFLSLAPHEPNLFSTFFRRAWVAILLLAINYPAAYAIIRAVSYIAARWPASGSLIGAD